MYVVCVFYLYVCLSLFICSHNLSIGLNTPRLTPVSVRILMKTCSVLTHTYRVKHTSFNPCVYLYSIEDLLCSNPHMFVCRLWFY